MMNFMLSADYVRSYSAETFIYLIPVLIATVLALIAQAGVKSTFRKYSSVMARSGVTASEAAKKILSANGISSVGVCRVSGELTDNFNPKTGTVNLSDPVYGSSSVAAIGVAAHETGHAIQHQTGYIPIKIRSAFVPVANFGSNAGIVLLLLGIVLDIFALQAVGLVLYSFILVFQLLTLPVEFNASRRAVAVLSADGSFSREELSGVKKVLTAAALTYVAAAILSAAQLLRYIAFARRRK